MNAIYILWLRELKKYVRSRTQILSSLAQPLLYLLALGFRTRTRIPKGRGRQLLAVRGTGRDWHDGSVYLDVLRYLFAVGSAVRILERNTGRAGAAYSGYAWPNAWRSNRCNVARSPDGSRVSDRGVPARKPEGDATRTALHSFDRICLCRARNVGLVQLAGYARVPAHHEFSGDAHFLFLRRSLPAGSLAAGARCAHNSRSTVIWRGWPAGYADWSDALWRTNGSGGTRPHLRRALMFGSLAVFEDRDLGRIWAMRSALWFRTASLPERFPRLMEAFDSTSLPAPHCQESEVYGFGAARH